MALRLALANSSGDGTKIKCGFRNKMAVVTGDLAGLATGADVMKRRGREVLL